MGTAVKLRYFYIALLLLVACRLPCFKKTVTYAFDPDKYEWYPPTEKKQIHFKSSDGLTETFDRSFVEHQELIGSVNNCKKAWIGEYSSVHYEPVLYDYEFRMQLSILESGHRFSFTIDDHNSAINLDTDENLNVLTGDNERYVSQISRLASLSLDSLVLYDLLKITDPLVASAGSAREVLHVYFSKEYGFVRYDYKDGTVWECEL